MIPQPSTVIKCSDITSCFQSIYNFLFAILIALAFLNFLYGAFLYLLSAGGVYSKDEGKKKMVNSIISVILALSIPVILYMINPNIFKAKLQVPEVKVEPPQFEVQIVGPAEAINGNYGTPEVIPQDERDDLQSAVEIINPLFYNVPTSPTKPGELSERLEAVQAVFNVAYNYVKAGVVNSTYCNVFVLRVLQDSGLIRNGICVPAADIDNMLANKCSKFTYNGVVHYMRWKKLPYSQDHLRPGDVLVREVPPGKQHGHTAIVVPIQNTKTGNLGLALAQASMNSHKPRITPLNLRAKFHHIMRMEEVNGSDCNGRFIN